MLSHDIFIAAENSFNLFTLAKNIDATTDEEQIRLNDSSAATIEEGADSLFGYADVSKYISTDIISATII